MRLASLALLLFAATLAPAQSPIRIGAWNIEHLGEPSNRDFPMHRPTHGFNVAQNPVQIANTIQTLNLDVLAMEEIYDTDGDADTRTNATLDAALAHLNTMPGNAWSYELFANRIRSDTSQVTGLAWNAAKVQPVGRHLRIAVADLTVMQFAEWDRAPHALKFTRGAGRTDFVVIPIHAKAGGGADEQEQREEEAKSLLRELPEIQENFGDGDVILIGDFNMHVHDETAGNQLGSKFVDLNSADQATHVTGNPLDRAYIPKSPAGAGRTDEFASSTFMVLEPPAAQKLAFQHDLSDHWPVVVTLAEQADDD